jgi:hypothetical protein
MVMMQNIIQHTRGENSMANSARLNVVVTDAEMIATVLQPVQRSSLDTEVTVTVQPAASQPIPVNKPALAVDISRFKIIQGL